MLSKPVVVLGLLPFQDLTTHLFDVLKGSKHYFFFVVLSRPKLKTKLSNVFVKNFQARAPRLIDRAYDLFSSCRLVEDIMSTDVVTTTPEVTMTDAVKIMGTKHIGSLIVTVDEKPQGIVTERDLLSKVLAKSKDPERVSVRDAMSSPLITIGSTATIQEAAQTMISQKGRLAVFQEEELVGIVTAADLIKRLPARATQMTIDNMMTTPVIMVPSNTTVKEVTIIMGEKRIGSVLVTRQEKPCGIFTERDLLATFLRKGNPLETRVEDTASSPLITIPLGTSVHQTALTMVLDHIRRLPIVKDDIIVGIVTARDLVKAWLQ